MALNRASIDSSWPHFVFFTHIIVRQLHIGTCHKGVNVTFLFTDTIFTVGLRLWGILRMGGANDADQPRGPTAEFFLAPQNSRIKGKIDIFVK